MMRAPKLLCVGLLALGSACVVRSDLKTGTFRFAVHLTLADGTPIPPEDKPLCLDLRGQNPACPNGLDVAVSVEAFDTVGARDTSFNGYVRVTTLPGTVVSVTGDRANGRNIRLQGGVAPPQIVHITGAYGPTRLVVEDGGYDPVDLGSGKVPACTDGKDNDGNGLIDYPADPGCAFPNDDTETPGTTSSGVSPVLWYRYPSVPEAQGLGATTPFQQESVILETRAERQANIVVVRVSAQGFYVSDLDSDAAGAITGKPKDYGSLFIFNFGLPDGVRVCDRVTYLAGTMSEFHGYTEMGFPSYGVKPWDPLLGACPVPEPFEITASTLAKPSLDADLERVEAGLVRIRGAHIAKKLGKGLAKRIDNAFDPKKNTSPCTLGSSSELSTYRFEFGPEATSCDFDGNGTTDFVVDVEEATCSCFCYDDAECSSWESYQSRGSFRMVALDDKPAASQTILANAGTIPGFEANAHRGEKVTAFTGTLANFSGGDLNWTIEARCADDLILCAPTDAACAMNPPTPPPASVACVKPRTKFDNEAGSN